MKNNKFRDVFCELKNGRLKIVDLSEETIESIQKSVDEYAISPRNSAFYAVTSTALLFIATAPAVISYYFAYASNIAPIIKGYFSQRNYLDTNIYINISCLFLVMAIPLYTLLMPLMPSKLISKNPFGPTNKDLKYFIYTILLHYFGVLIPLLYITSYQLVASRIVIYIIITWLMIPGILLSICPTLIIMFIMAFFVLNKFNKVTSHLLPGVIANELVLLLKDIDSSDFTRLRNNDTMQKLNEKIMKISDLIGDMKLSFVGISTPVNRFLTEKFEAASYAFYSLKLCVLLPDSSSKNILTQKVVSVLNIFLTGNYRNLPDYPYINHPDIKESKRASFLRSALSLVTLGLFLATPVIFWGLILWRYNPTLDASIQTLLAILYTVWCIVGILSHSDRLAPEAKELIIDTIKLILSKK
jgi:hypothetical protein